MTQPSSDRCGCSPPSARVIYLRLGQPATELSGGEALYVLDEPTTGLHPSDVDKLMTQLDGLVDAGNTVIVVEHEMRLVSACDWAIDMGPGAGDEGGRILAMGSPREVAKAKGSKTAAYLARWTAPRE